MTKKAKWTSLILVGLCLLAPVAVGPPLAAGQGAEDEYNLDLPGSGGDETTPAANPAANTSESDDGGFPVLAVVLFALAGVGVGLALWRLRTRQAYERTGLDEPDEDG